MNECSKEFETVYLANNSLPEPGVCIADSTQTKEWNVLLQYCSRISLVWAVGGSEIQDFPEDLAYPIGGSEDEFKYFYLEIHYDNPHKVPSIKNLSHKSLDYS